MFSKIRMPVAVLTVFCSFSCSDQKSGSQQNEKTNFILKLVDSVQVDFLGDMKLVDYDPKTERYLLATDYTEKYMEVDQHGEILTQKDFTADTKDAVGFVLGSGYLDGEVVVLSETKGYLMYKDGLKSGEIKLSYNFIPFIIYPKLKIFRYGNRLYYPRPMQESINALRQETGAFTSAIYRMPAMEGQEISSGDTISVMRLPEISGILDGQMHGMTFPVISETERHVLLSTWIEPVIYVYSKLNGEIVYDQSVQIDIPDWVSYTPTELEDREGFYLQNNKRINGNLVDVLESGEYYIAVYQKGIEENKMPEKDEDQEKYNLEIKRKNRYYAAIFDKEFKQLAVNVPFPASSAVPGVVNKAGEIMVSKNASLSETEDDGIILYKLKLEQE